MVTQAQATAFASSQLAALAQKKRCLGTATQSLGVFVRCRLRRPLWCQLAQWSRRLRLPPSPALSSLRSLRKAVSRHCYAEPRRFCAVSAAPSALVPASPMVTQAQATAFASSQLAALAQKKRCLGTATQSLGVFVRCRLRRPLWCQLAQWSRRLRLPPSPALSSLRSLRKAVSRHCYAEPRRFCAVSAAPSALVPAP